MMWSHGKEVTAINIFESFGQLFDVDQLLIPGLLPVYLFQIDRHGTLFPVIKNSRVPKDIQPLQDYRFDATFWKRYSIPIEACTLRIKR